MSDEHDDILGDEFTKKKGGDVDEFGEPLLDEDLDDGMGDLLFPGGDSDDDLL